MGEARRFQRQVRWIRSSDKIMPTNGFVSREDDCDSHVWLSRDGTIVKARGSWCQQGNVHSVQRVHRFQIIEVAMPCAPSSPSSPSTHRTSEVPESSCRRFASIRIDSWCRPRMAQMVVGIMDVMDVQAESGAEPCKSRKICQQTITLHKIMSVFNANNFGCECLLNAQNCLACADRVALPSRAAVKRLPSK
jgi:hypothetical protein